MKPKQPFGPPAALAVTLVEELTLSASCAVSLLTALRREGARGLVLFETADRSASSAEARTLLISRSWLRLELRAGRVHLTALVDEAKELVRLLEQRLLPQYPTQPTGHEANERLMQASVLDALRAAAGLVGEREPSGLPLGLFGAFSYELVDHFENLNERRPDPLGEADASFVLGGDLIEIDAVSGRARVATRGLPWERIGDVRERHQQMLARLSKMSTVPEPVAAPDLCERELTFDLQPDSFHAAVESFRENIYAGEIFQGVLSRGTRLTSEASSLEVYRALRSFNPSPYMFHFDLEQGSLLGASPESFLKVEDGRVAVRPIAGTTTRGLHPDGSIDPDRDGRLALALLLDRKEQAEHAMLVDLARNDVARVCVPRTTQVTEAFAIEAFSHVQHLVSRVEGDLREGLDALHAYRAAANAGTLTGAPKPRAMELIRETEPTARGYYGGAAGYLLQDGSFDSCIVIRSLRHHQGSYYVRAGAGIVLDSDPERERIETENKAKAPLRAVAMAEAGR